MSHNRGNECSDCCCGGPQKCTEEYCKGFVHLEVKDEVQVAEDDWEWVHDYRCDSCSYESAAYPDEGNGVIFNDERK